MLKKTITTYECQFCGEKFNKEDACIDHEYGHLNKTVTITELINIVEKYYGNWSHRINSDIKILSEGGTPTACKIIGSDMDGTPVSPSSILLRLAYIIKNEVGDLNITINDNIDNIKYEPIDKVV